MYLKTLEILDRILYTQSPTVRMVGIVRAKNVTEVPMKSAPNGVYQFDSPRYAIYITEKYDNDGKQLPIPNDGMLYLPMDLSNEKVELL